MIHIGDSSDGTDSTPGVEATTIITAITVPLSCVVSFIIGVLVGAVVHFYAVRKKHTVDMRKRPTVALGPDTEYEDVSDVPRPTVVLGPDTEYVDVSDVPSPESINLEENAAYAHVQH